MAKMVNFYPVGIQTFSNILHLSNIPRCDCAAKLQFFQ
jgi:hypothetical protein